MKKKILFPACAPAALILVLTIVLQGPGTQAASSFSDRITVMNPAIATAYAERVPLTPRPDTVEGKTIYIVDMNYEGFGITPVLEEMRAWFAENMPGVKAVLRLKRGNYVDNDPALWKEIAASGAGGVIIGVAG
ncbi:MAG TPA: hypothetical protein VLL97_11530 [Acidobacteriota bacterium]|nr:hypothetical protein [Acidobacteriota bacterium]